MPYKRRKRESSQSGSPVLKKSMSLSSEQSLKREGIEEGNTVSVLVRIVKVNKSNKKH